MSTLILLRHGKSNWSGGEPDHLRPLARRGRRQVPVAGRWIADNVGVIDLVHSASCRFRIPLTYPDTVTVGARIGDVGEDRFEMLYRAVSHRYDAVTADGESLIVTFDYTTSAKARVSDHLRALLLELRGKRSIAARPVQH